MMAFWMPNYSCASESAFISVSLEECNTFAVRRCGHADILGKIYVGPLSQ